MEITEFVSGARDAVSVKRVYGEPYVTNGLTVIPAATVRGGAGQGMGDHDGGEATGGGGFGLTARPTGAWIIEEGRATWKPAVDVNRIVLGAQTIALAAILVTGRVLLAHSRPRPKYADLIARLPTRRRRQFRLPEPRMRTQLHVPKLSR